MLLKRRNQIIPFIRNSIIVSFGAAFFQLIQTFVPEHILAIGLQQKHKQLNSTDKVTVGDSLLFGRVIISNIVFNSKKYDLSTSAR